MKCAQAWQHPQERDSKNEREVLPNMYAILVTGGKQYKVSEGDVIYVEKLVLQIGRAHV